MDFVVLGKTFLKTILDDFSLKNPIFIFEKIETFCLRVTF